MMKKVILVHMLWLLSISLVCSQPAADSACNATIENILKVHNLKMKYEAVQSLYERLDIKDSVIRNKRTYLHTSKSVLNTYSEFIRGRPMDGYEVPVVSSEERTKHMGMTLEERNRYFQQLRDSISRSKPVSVVWVTDEEMSRFVEQINCTPQEAREEYFGFIRDIKSERERYLKCIDMVLAEGDSSEFAKESLLYTFLEPGDSISGPKTFTKLEFLKIFKEFIFNDDAVLLPDDIRTQVYLKCGCKFP